MGEAPVLVHGKKKLSQSAVILTYLANHSGQYKPQGEDEELESLRWIVFDNQKVNGFLGPYRFLKNFAPKPGDPAVMAFMKGRIDGALAIVEKRLTGRQFLVAERPTIADISMTAYLYYPAEEFGFDIVQGLSGDRRLAQAHRGAARLGTSLRHHAGLPVRHAGLSQSLISDGGRGRGHGRDRAHDRGRGRGRVRDRGRAHAPLHRRRLPARTAPRCAPAWRRAP